MARLFSKGVKSEKLIKIYLNEEVEEVRVNI